MRSAALLGLAALLPVTLGSGAPPPPAQHGWPAPIAKAVPQTDGYVPIANVAVPPRRDRVYRAIFDATRGADKSTELLPAVNNAGSEVNAFAVAGVPRQNAKFAIVFHGAAIDGILDDAHYRSKHGVRNPNLPALAALRKAGVELFVCGQNLAFEKIDPRALSPEVRIASDALIVLMTYENDGYAVLEF